MKEVVTRIMHDSGALHPPPCMPMCQGNRVSQSLGENEVKGQTLSTENLGKWGKGGGRGLTKRKKVGRANHDLMIWRELRKTAFRPSPEGCRVESCRSWTCTHTRTFVKKQSQCLFPYILIVKFFISNPDLQARFLQFFSLYLSRVPFRGSPL